MQEAAGLSVCSMIRIMLYGHPNLSLPYAMKDGEEGRNKDGISKEEAAIMANCYPDEDDQGFDIHFRVNPRILFAFLEPSLHYKFALKVEITFLFTFVNNYLPFIA